MIRKSKVSLYIAAIAVNGCTHSSGERDYVTQFYDMSDKSFSVQAIAPPDVVRELAICKAVWFAEKKNVQSISLGNPIYGPPKMPISVNIPEGSVALSATVYLSGPNPDGNAAVDVGETAIACRRAWHWYR